MHRRSTAPSPHHRHHQGPPARVVHPLPTIGGNAKASADLQVGLGKSYPHLPTESGQMLVTLATYSFRATSVAQYVRMTLAPARRIEVRVSMIALSRSTQPLAAAASTIANSPLT